MAITQHRGDVDGLRAVAVLLVIGFHMELERLPARFGLQLFGGGFVGVDVFFVISGFLITGLLVRETFETGKIGFVDFYVRRARRLLPMSSAVLSVTMLAAFLLLPSIDWPEIARDAVLSAFYVVNVGFASRATEYMLLDVNESPLLHYWSLSAEEQFYFIWPTLLLLAYGRGGANRRARMVALVGAIIVASFAASVWLTYSNGPWAYFGLPTRAWELGIGAMLALFRDELSRIPGWLLRVLGWSGIGLILSSFVWFGRGTPFPGAWALLPVGGSAFVIMAGAGIMMRGSIGGLLSLGPMQYLGRISYAWYLWHWPCLLYAGPIVGATGRPAANVILAAVGVSFVLAVLSHHLIEQPARHSVLFSRPRGAILLVASSMVVVLLGAGPLVAVGSAASIDATEPSFARRDRVRSLDGCTQNFIQTEASPCLFGVPEAEVRLVLIGDSHAAHLVPAFDVVARERGWGAALYSKASCPPISVRRWLENYRREYTECTAWRTNVLAAVEDVRPGVIVVARFGGYADDLLEANGARARSDRVSAIWEEGARGAFAEWSSAAEQLVIMRDVPNPGFDIPACISSKGTDLCSFETRRAVHWDDELYDAEVRAAEGIQGVTFIDLSQEICGSALCSPVTGEGIIKYRDRNHLTATFSSMLGPALQRLLPR
jgi:peptidoglycan/LPS O-acetylase OafA/YrhL